MNQVTALEIEKSEYQKLYDNLDYEIGYSLDNTITVLYQGTKLIAFRQNANYYAIDD